MPGTPLLPREISTVKKDREDSSLQFSADSERGIDHCRAHILVA
jgi:hypothetical protein